MKKYAIILSIISVSLFSAFAFAEEQKKPRPQQPTVVATSDGGVVVLQGPKLVKYDAMLTLVNEVELPKGGPSPDKRNWKEMPQAETGAQPMNDAEVAAILDQEPPVEAPVETPSEAPFEPPPAEEPPPVL